MGTAGWNVPSQYAAQSCGTGAHLERYARRLNAVEINSSFYRPHRRQTFERWAGSVPPHFRFAVKIPRQITPVCGLVDSEERLDSFAAEVAGLGTSLGVLLVQLPPSLAFDVECATQFFAALRGRALTRVWAWLASRDIAAGLRRPPMSSCRLTRLRG